jgi:hypothetical protein
MTIPPRAAALKNPASAFAPGPAAPESRTFTAAAWLLLLVFPWALYLVNDSWAYNHNFSIAGFFTGYFLYWPDFLREFPQAYQGSRLLWIIPGWLAHHLFTPYWANLALRAFVIYGTAVPAWFTLRRLGAGVGGATASTLLLISNPYFLQAAGWDYVNGSGIVYIAWSLFLLAAAAQSPRRNGWLAAAGAAMIATVWSYLLVAFFAPVYAWFYLRLRGWPRPLPALREIGWLLLGGGTLTVCLGLINLAVGGRFLFFLLQFQASKPLINGTGNAYVMPQVWLPESPWLIVPCLSLLAGTLLALPSVLKRWGFDRRAEAAGVAMLLAFAVMAGVELTGTWPVLHYAFATHASYLLPFAALPLGLVLDRHLIRFPPREQFGILCLTALVLLAMYFTPWVPLLRHGPLLNHGSFVCVALAAALVAAAAYRPTAAGLLVFLLGLSWLNLGTAAHASWPILAPPDARDRHLLIFDVLPRISALNADDNLMLWYNRPTGDPDGLLADFVEFSGGFGPRKNRVINAFPFLLRITHYGVAAENDMQDQLQPGTRAVLLGDPSPLSLVRATLAKKNLTLRILHQETVRHGAASIPLTVLVIESAHA